MATKTRLKPTGTRDGGVRMPAGADPGRPSTKNVVATLARIGRPGREGEVQLAADGGTGCDLTTAPARDALAAVLAQIRGRCREDGERITRACRVVAPLSAEQQADGTLAEWSRNERADYPVREEAENAAGWVHNLYGPNQTTWPAAVRVQFRRLADIADECPGVLLLKENQAGWALRAAIAHEFGHVCTRSEDLEYGNAPTTEWASEAAADRYAYRWGFGQLIGRLRRTRNLLHHGPNPGQPVSIGPQGQEVHYRVTRDFQFVRISNTTTKAKRAR